MIGTFAIRHVPRPGLRRAWGGLGLGSAMGRARQAEVDGKVTAW